MASIVKRLSDLADEHTISGDRNSPNYHQIGHALHDAASKVGAHFGMSWDNPIIQHHAHSAVFHKKMSEGGYGNPTEGPHAPGKGSVLGVPVSYSSGK